MKTVTKLVAFFAILVLVTIEKVSAQQSYRLAKAIDVNQATTFTMFNCCKAHGHEIAFIRIYEATGKGQVDKNGATNILNAKSAKMATEKFVTPNPTGGKPGNIQLYEAYTDLKKQDIPLDFVWLQVTSPAKWSTNHQTNIKFIDEFIRGTVEQTKLHMGIYTNHDDWHDITGDWTGWQQYGDIKLWYWNVTGPGSMGATANNFSDFKSFAGFKYSQVQVKQYARNIPVCDIYVNMNVYALRKNTEK